MRLIKLIKLDPNTAEIRVCKSRGESNADILTAWLKKRKKKEKKAFGLTESRVFTTHGFS